MMKHINTWLCEIPAEIAEEIVALPEYVNDHSASCKLYQKKGGKRYFWYWGRLGCGIIKMEATDNPRHHSSRITYYLSTKGN